VLKRFAIDLRVLGFTLGVSLLTGILFGLLPALQASRPNLNERLKAGGRSAPAALVDNKSVAFSWSVNCSVACTAIGAGLLIKSFLRLQSVNPGFNSKNVLTMQLDLSGPNYKKGSQVITFHDQLLERIKDCRAFQYASTRSFVPIASDASFAYLLFHIEGRQSDVAEGSVAFYNAVSPDYFQTMMILCGKGEGSTKEI